LTVTLRDYLIAGRLMGLAVFAPGIALAMLDVSSGRE
jgi:hypothetical protein